MIRCDGLFIALPDTVFEELWHKLHDLALLIQVLLVGTLHGKLVVICDRTQIRYAINLAGVLFIRSIRLYDTALFLHDSVLHALLQSLEDGVGLIFVIFFLDVDLDGDPELFGIELGVHLACGALIPLIEIVAGLQNQLLDRRHVGLSVPFLLYLIKFGHQLVMEHNMVLRHADHRNRSLVVLVLALNLLLVRGVTMVFVT